MSEQPAGEALSERRHLTLILRLLVDRQGAVHSGEVVGLDGRTWGRFVGLEGLIRALRSSIAQHPDVPSREVDQS